MKKSINLIYRSDQIVNWCFILLLTTQALHHYNKRKNKPCKILVYCEQDILLGVVLIVFYVYKNVQQFKDFFVKYVCRCTETEMYRLLDIQLNLFLFFLTITLVLIMVFVKFFKILFSTYNKTWFFTKMPQLEGKIGYKRKNSLYIYLNRHKAHPS